MQMIHTTGTSLTHSKQNIVDLAEYRRTLAMAQPPASSNSYPLILEQENQSKRPSFSGQMLLPWLLDIIASVTVLMMTLAFTLEILSV